MEELTPDECREYINLVDRFSSAKRKKHYDLSDKFRQELQEWQSGLSDNHFIAMSENHSYQFNSMIETQGEHGHRFKRLNKRENDRT